MSALNRLARHAATGLVLGAEETREVLACIAGLGTQRDEMLASLKNAKGLLEDFEEISAYGVICKAIAKVTGP